jgi:hypothetical protein
MLNWSEKVKLYKTAYILKNEKEIYASAAPMNGDRVQTGGRGGGRCFLEWAIDVLLHSTPDIERYYLRDNGAEYEPVTGKLSAELRKFWKSVRERKLDQDGLRIVDLLYQSPRELFDSGIMEDE